jgi:hypothetical protein
MKIFFLHNETLLYVLSSLRRRGCLTIGQNCHSGRDPWFDKLTILSEAEGESRKVEEDQVILDPGSHPPPGDLAGMTNGGRISSQKITPSLQSLLNGRRKGVKI